MGAVKLFITKSINLEQDESCIKHFFNLMVDKEIPIVGFIRDPEEGIYIIGEEECFAIFFKNLPPYAQQLEKFDFEKFIEEDKHNSTVYLVDYLGEKINLMKFV